MLRRRVGIVEPEDWMRFKIVEQAFGFRPLDEGLPRLFFGVGSKAVRACYADWLEALKADVRCIHHCPFFNVARAICALMRGQEIIPVVDET
jgi:hypothetical protein